MRGFSKDDAVTLTGDSISHLARWNHQSLDQLPPGKCMLRLHLDNAEVFAITLE